MSEKLNDDNSIMSDEEDTGKTIYDFLDKFSPEDYKTFIHEFKEMALETRHVRLAERKTLSWTVFMLLAMILLAITALAWIGKIEGYYVTSVGGVIAGYMLSFLETSFKPTTDS